MTQKVKKYVVRRTTSEEQATAVCNEASAKGFECESVTGGGGDLNVLWIIFSKPCESADSPPAPAPAPAPPAGTAGGGFGD